MRLHPDQWGDELGRIVRRPEDTAGFFGPIVIFTVGFLVCVLILLLEVALEVAGGDGSPARAALAVAIFSPFPTWLIARLEYRIWARAKNSGRYLDT